MKIIILGKNGQLGTELTLQAEKLKYTVYSYTREELDILDKEKIKKIVAKIKPDYFINASAFHVVPECEENPQKAFEINASSLKYLADICNETHTKIVHFSTDYVFDGLKGKPYKEADIPNPLQIYGISKFAGENTLLQYANNGIVIRTCGVYGGKFGSRAKKGNFVLTILKQIEGKKELEVSSEQIVNPTYAKDLATATLKLLKLKNAKGIYHLASQGYCSWAEFAQEIIKSKKIKAKIIPVDRKGLAGTLRRPLFSALSNTRAKKLGIQIPSWKKSLKDYLKTI